MTFVLFLLLLFGLVVVHEAGHFFAARIFGIRVEEFGFGFPPRLAAFVRKGTAYSLNLLPFGGFVRLLGEEGGGAENPESFAAKPLRIRLAVLYAGVAMNFLGAVALLTIILFFGAPLPTPDSINAPNAVVSISAVGKDTPAEIAGIRAGDRIISMRAAAEETTPHTVAEVRAFTSAHAGEELAIVIQRSSDQFTVTATPRTNPPEGQGALGVALVRIAQRSFPWYETPWRATFLAANSTILIVHGFANIIGDLFAGQGVGDAVAGPVGIAAITGDVAGLGFPYLIYFAALLSINLAILNIIPFPALDGGRAVMLVAERVVGRPLPRKISEAINAAGFALLILLLIFITIHDLTKQF